VETSGPDVLQFLEHIFVRKISNLKQERGRYAIAWTRQGGLFMDRVLFRLADDRFCFVQLNGVLDTWLLAHKRDFDIHVADPQSHVLQI
jgi:aminomethyltransferase